MVSATFDTSVYVRALQLGGPAGMLIGYARAREIRIDVSFAILDETLRVLRSKFGWSAEMAHFTRLKLVNISNVVAPAETLAVIEYDPPDNRVLECARRRNLSTSSQRIKIFCGYVNTPGRRS